MDETSEQRLLVGVDGGASGCRVAIANGSSEHVLATATGGPANIATDFESAVQNIEEAISQAAHGGGLGESALATAVAHLGLAGVLCEEDASRVSGAFEFAGCSVTDDRATSVTGALGERDGLVLAVGTGTFVAARRGATIRAVGGWGLDVGDQASGAWLGRALLERVLLCHDGLERHTDLTRSVLGAFGNDPVAIVRHAAAAKPPAFAALAPQIVAASGAGDAVAHALMCQGAAYLSRAVEVLGGGAGDVVCLAGGVGPHYSTYLAPPLREHIVAPVGTALDGALSLAALRHRELLGRA
ncbi:MAG: BadF/BadG/BcrA/BcrD ATPase family protein [Pseudomonadota bacterium]